MSTSNEHLHKQNEQEIQEEYAKPNSKNEQKQELNPI